MATLRHTTYAKALTLGNKLELAAIYRDALDQIAIMVIFCPMLIAIVIRFGVDPVHFGAIMVNQCRIGMAALPIGYCLFIGMAVNRLILGAVARRIWPMIVVMPIVLFLTTYVPQFPLSWQGEAREKLDKADAETRKAHLRSVIVGSRLITKPTRRSISACVNGHGALAA